MNAVSRVIMGRETIRTEDAMLPTWLIEKIERQRREREAEERPGLRIEPPEGSERAPPSPGGDDELPRRSPVVVIEL